MAENTEFGIDIDTLKKNENITGTYAVLSNSKQNELSSEISDDDILKEPFDKSADKCERPCNESNLQLVEHTTNTNEKIEENNSEIIVSTSDESDHISVLQNQDLPKSIESRKCVQVIEHPLSNEDDDLMRDNNKDVVSDLSKTLDELIFIDDHYKDSIQSLDSLASTESEVIPDPYDSNLELFSTDLSKELSDVGRYSYAGLVAHSLFALYEYTPCHKKFQEGCMKHLLTHLSLSKQVEDTMMMMTTGEVDVGSVKPFVNALKKDPFILKTGLHCVPYDLFVRSLREGVYDARTRTLVKYVGFHSGVDWHVMECLEESALNHFIENEHLPTEQEMKEKKDAATNRKIKRAALIGLATVGGGVLIGLTAGLAAPLIAAGAGVIIGGAGGAILGSAAGVAVIGSLFGVAGAGLTGYKMNKRVGGLEEFEFEPLTTGHSLHVTIAISGWLTDKHPDFKESWLGLAHSKEQYALKFESKYMRELGQALDYIVGIAVGAAVKEGLKHTILSGLLAAIAWPAALLSIASIIDNPWSIVTQRSVNAGRQLAEVLLSRQQGRRPVTLIGYSFGARVIFACLQEMATRKNCEGIIEDVILLGAPVTGSVQEWSRLAGVVSGRMINGYSGADWLLKFMYRTASVQMSIAGLSPVKWQHRLMRNIDLSSIVTGHKDYFNKMDQILDFIGISTKNHAALGAGANSLRQWSDILRVDYKTKSKDSGISTMSATSSEDKSGHDPISNITDSAKQESLVLEDSACDVQRNMTTNA